MFLDLEHEWMVLTTLGGNLELNEIIKSVNSTRMAKAKCARGSVQSEVPDMTRVGAVKTKCSVL